MWWIDIYIYIYKYIYKHTHIYIYIFMYIIRKLFVYMSLIHCHSLRDMAYCVFDTCRYDEVVPFPRNEGKGKWWFVKGRCVFREKEFCEPGAKAFWVGISAPTTEFLRACESLGFYGLEIYWVIVLCYLFFFFVFFFPCVTTVGRQVAA